MRRLHVDIQFLVRPTVALRINQGIIPHYGKRRSTQCPLAHVVFDTLVHAGQCGRIGNIIGKGFIEPQLDSSRNGNRFLLMGRGQRYAKSCCTGGKT